MQELAIVHMSVRPSVTLWYCIKTNKVIISSPT